MTKVSVVKEEKKFGTIISDIIKEHETKTKTIGNKPNKKLPYIMNTTNSPVAIGTCKISQGSREAIIINGTYLKEMFPKDDEYFNKELKNFYANGLLKDCSEAEHNKIELGKLEKERERFLAKEKKIDRTVVPCVKEDCLKNQDIDRIDLEDDVFKNGLSHSELISILNEIENAGGSSDVAKEIVAPDGKSTIIYKQEPKNYFTIDPEKLKPFNKKAAVEALQENPVVNSCSLGQINNEKLSVVVDTPFMRALDILVRDNIEFRSSDWYRKETHEYSCKEYSTLGVRIHRRGGHSIGSCLVLNRYFNKILFVSMSHDNAEATKTECKKIGIDTSKITFGTISSHSYRGQTYDCVVVDCFSWQDAEKLKEFETSICEPMFRADPINFLYVRVE